MPYQSYLYKSSGIHLLLQESLDHVIDLPDITGTEKWRSMGVSFLSGGGYRHHIAASEKQKKQQQEEDNKNQILINDLDGIQILIKSE